MHSTRFRAFVVAMVTSLALLAVPAAAAADVTAFLGLGMKPATRSAKGAAIGMTLVVVGFEGEYSSISEDTADSAPSVRTGMINAIVQTPTGSTQLYATAGAGLYRESFRNGPSETNTGVNIGGGIKRGLLGPVKLRVDYRIFKFRGDALHKTLHRVYVGLNAGL